MVWVTNETGLHITFARVINFTPFNSHTMPFFKKCNILKFADIINVGSCIFINNCFSNDPFSIFH